LNTAVRTPAERWFGNPAGGAGLMAWPVEIIIEGFWQSAIHAAYRRWGLLGGAVALLSPFITFGPLPWWETQR
jgi:hypothetical protein